MHRRVLSISLSVCSHVPALSSSSSTDLATSPSASALITSLQAINRCLVSYYDLQFALAKHFPRLPLADPSEPLHVRNTPRTLRRVFCHTHTHAIAQSCSSLFNDIFRLLLQAFDAQCVTPLSPPPPSSLLPAASIFNTIVAVRAIYLSITRRTIPPAPAATHAVKEKDKRFDRRPSIDHVRACHCHTSKIKTLNPCYLG